MWHFSAYRDFYDVPRAIVARNDTATYYFLCRFNDTLDEYDSFYAVYRLPHIAAATLGESWVGLEDTAIERLNNVSIHDVPFDTPTRTLGEFDVEALAGRR